MPPEESVDRLTEDSAWRKPQKMEMPQADSQQIKKCEDRWKVKQGLSWNKKITVWQLHNVEKNDRNFRRDIAISRRLYAKTKNL